MILWSVVLNKLKPHCPEGTDTIEDALIWLYQVKQLGLHKIASLTDNFVSGATIKAKLKSIGVPIRSRGGWHKPVIELTKEEVLNMTAKELALKYKVSLPTIYARRRKIVKELEEQAHALLFGDTSQE